MRYTLCLFVIFFLTLSEIHSAPATAPLIEKINDSLENPLSLSETEPGQQQKESIFNYDKPSDVYTTLSHAHHSLKSLLIKPAQALDEMIPSFDMIFLFLFCCYIACAFIINYNLQNLTKRHKNPLFLQIFFILLLLLINTVFYGLGEEHIKDPELKQGLKLFIFMLSFMTFNRTILCYILGIPYNFFHPIQETKTLQKKYRLHLVSELNLFETIIKYYLPVFVIALQAADFIHYCFNFSQTCDDFLQVLVLFALKGIFISYLATFYLSIYTEILKLTEFQKKLWLGIIISASLFFAWKTPSLIGLDGEWFQKFALNVFICFFPFLNLPLYRLIASKIHTVQTSEESVVNTKKLFKDLTEYMFLIISIVVSLRLLVIFNSFPEAHGWFKEFANIVYERFITISFISFISLGIYYKILLKARTLTSRYENTNRDNEFYNIHGNSKLMAITRTIADFGPILFWPLFFYEILIELGLNPVYLSSFYGVVVAGLLLGGKDNIGEVLKGIGYIFQGIIIRGGKITVAAKDFNSSLYGIIEKVTLRNFYLRDKEGLLHFISFNSVSGITFHNEVYSHFSLILSEGVELELIEALLSETKEAFNKEHDDGVEQIQLFKVEKVDTTKLRIQYLLKGKPAKVWKTQSLFEKSLGQALRKNKISYTLEENKNS